MKQRLVSFIVLLAVALTAIPAFAQDARVNVYGRASTTPVKARVDVRTEVKERREDRREDRKASSTERRVEMKANIEERKASTTERKEERRENIAERKASSTERRVEMQRGLAKKKAAHTSRVLAATVERLEQIITRLESRIAKYKANGVVTIEAERFVAEAKTSLSAAKSNIALFVSLDLSGDKAQENFERVRNLATETKGHLRAAHDNLMKAIRSLTTGGRTDIQLEINANATSTQ